MFPDGGLTPVPPKQLPVVARGGDDKAAAGTVPLPGPAEAPLTRADLQQTADLAAYKALQAAGIGVGDHVHRSSMPSVAGAGEPLARAEGK